MTDAPQFASLTVIHSGPRHRIFRGRHSDTGHSVIVKSPVGDSPDAETALRREHKLLSSLSIDGIVRVEGLTRIDGTTAIIEEDLGPITLAHRLRSEPLTLGQFFSLAETLANSVSALHAAHTIHRDLHPANIVLRAGHTPCLVDFGLATKTTDVRPLTHPIGNLPFISPEQTGRTSRTPDWRTDLYSLGAIYYFLLTGRPPFTTDDPAALVHAHLALRPTPLDQLRQGLPPLVSTLVLKLLAKSPDERYQTADALADDLRRMHREFHTDGSVNPFALATRDVSPVLAFPSELRGRDTALATLRTAFDLATQGQPQFVFVSGPAGIGKTALVRAFHRSLQYRSKLYGAGKSDLLDRPVPYRPLSDALRTVFKKLLAEPEAKLSLWRDALQNSLGLAPAPLTDLIPELGAILGAREAPGTATAVGPIETRNRLHDLFARLIRCLARPAEPLVLVFDDLQWIDSDSLDLLESGFSQSTGSGLLIVACARPQDPEHSGHSGPESTLTRLERMGVTVRMVSLAPLSPHEITEYLSSTLRAPTDAVEDLATVMATRTQGNPLFLQRLLKRMHTDGALRFDHPRRCWNWNTDALAGVGLSDDVIALMLGDLERLPGPCLSALQTAACIGSRFSLSLIARVNAVPLAEVIEALVPAAEHGLIAAASALYPDPRSPGQTPQSASSSVTRFAFTHDRVQETIYQHLSSDRRDELHRRIATKLIESSASHDDQLFDTVDQLRLGARCITAPDERSRALDLALRAGRRAHQSAAYHAALGYFDLALTLLPDAPWQSAHELTLTLHLDSARCAFLSGDHHRADALIDSALEHTHDLTAYADFLDLRVLAATADGRYAEAVDLARASAALFTETLPAHGETVDVTAALDLVDTSLGLRPPSEFVSLPEATTPRDTALSRSLSLAVAAAYFSNTGLFVWLNARVIVLALRDGPTPHTAFSLVAHGMVVGATNPLRGRDFGLAGVSIARRHNNPAELCRTLHTFSSHINHWSRPLASDIPLAREALRAGIDSGEHLFAGYAAAGIALQRWSAGHSLDDVLDDTATGLDFTHRTAHRDMTLMLLSLRQSARAMKGLTASMSSLDDADFTESTHIEALSASPTAMFVYRVTRAALAVYQHKLDRAREELSHARPLAPFALGLITTADMAFYEALCTPETAAERERELTHWAEHCPENFSHKTDLLAALRLAAAGDTWSARVRFERAIEGARANGFMQDEALASEFLAEFLDSYAMHGAAVLLGTAAATAWRRWGSEPKAEALTLRWAPSLLRPAPTATPGNTALSLDALSVAKASQALSEHMVLEVLLGRVVHVLLESAGGTGGALVLDEDTVLTVRARGTADDSATVDHTATRLDACTDLPRAIVEFCFRTTQPVVLSDATAHGQFTDDPVVCARAIRSVLCVPLRYGGRVAGVIYLESLAAAHIFTHDRVVLVQHLATQLAISLQNSFLFESLQHEVRERERAEAALQFANTDLEARIASRTQELEHLARAERRAREDLERTQIHLVQSEKLASLGQMVAGIAHEINNPLSFVNNNIAVLQRDVTSAMEILDLWTQARPTVEEHLPTLVSRIDTLSDRLDLGYVKNRLPEVFKSTRDGMRRITAIVADLRVFARLDLGSTEELDLNPGVSSTLHILRGRAEHRGVTLIADLGPAVTVRCQPAKINQVVMNLVANAIDAAPPHSIVTVSTRGTTDTFELTVDDHGAGVPMALRSRIFDPFFTTKAQGQGTGLGLSISYSIAHEHNGELTVSDSPSGGARFTLRLPRSPSTPPPLPPPPSSP